MWRQFAIAGSLTQHKQPHLLTANDAMPKTALITHQDCTLHEISPGHPERPQRIGAVLDQLVEHGLVEKLHRFEASEASREHLLAAHSESYVDHLFDVAPNLSLIHI